MSTINTERAPKGIEWTVKYDAVCSLYTHPRQLAASALLAGFQPEPTETSRILELGCAIGGNLTPIAASLPQSTCLGIDPFTEQIQLARLRSRDAGINNVTYLPLGVSDIDQIEGEFDYIIAHGLFSWISDQHREDTLKLCRDKLSPRGIAYISYNTYPGWHQRDLVRHLLRWQKKHYERRADQRGVTPQDTEMIKEARLALKFFAQYTQSITNKGNQELISTIENDLRKFPDWYLVHEYLLEHNHPYYFEDFIEEINHHQLTYLSDASSNAQLASRLLSPQMLREIDFMCDDAVGREQGLDFLLNRSMRRAIITKTENISRADMSPPIYLWGEERVGESRDLDAEIFVTTHLTLVTELKDLSGPATYHSQHDNKTSFTVNSVIENALMILLSTVWPKVISIKELRAQTQALLSEFNHLGTGAFPQLFSVALSTLISKGMIYHPTWGYRGHLTERADETEDSIPPQKLVPWLKGAEAEMMSMVTNAHHYPVSIDSEELAVMKETLSGTTKREQETQMSSSDPLFVKTYTRAKALGLLD